MVPPPPPPPTPPLNQGSESSHLLPRETDDKQHILRLKRYHKILKIIRLYSQSNIPFYYPVYSAPFTTIYKNINGCVLPACPACHVLIVCFRSFPPPPIRFLARKRTKTSCMPFAVILGGRGPTISLLPLPNSSLGSRHRPNNLYFKTFRRFWISSSFAENCAEWWVGR